MIYLSTHTYSYGLLVEMKIPMLCSIHGTVVLAQVINSFLVILWQYLDILCSTCINTNGIKSGVVGLFYLYVILVGKLRKTLKTT